MIGPRAVKDKGAMPIIKIRRRREAKKSKANMGNSEQETLRPGDLLKVVKPIRSQKTGVFLPREGTFVRAVENMGRKLILVNFGPAGEEYLFPDEVAPEPSR